MKKSQFGNNILLIYFIIIINKEIMTFNYFIKLFAFFYVFNKNIFFYV